jgi:phosphoribosylanthranilate isomerase
VCPRVLSVGDGGIVPAGVRDARSVAGIVIVDVSSEVSERAKRAAELAKGTQSRF